MLTFSQFFQMGFASGYKKLATQILFLIENNFENKNHRGGDIRKMWITKFSQTRDTLAWVLSHNINKDFFKLNLKEQSKIMQSIAKHLTETIISNRPKSIRSKENIYHHGYKSRMYREEDIVLTIEHIKWERPVGDGANHGETTKVQHFVKFPEKLFLHQDDLTQQLKDIFAQLPNTLREMSSAETQESFNHHDGHLYMRLK